MNCAEGGLTPCEEDSTHWQCQGSVTPLFFGKDSLVIYKIKDSQGYILEFTSKQSLKNFLRKEHDFWKSVQAELVIPERYGYSWSEGESARRVLQSVKTIEQLLSLIGKKDSPKTEALLSDFSSELESGWIFSKHETTQLWLEIYKFNPIAGDTFYRDTVVESPNYEAIGQKLAIEYKLKKTEIKDLNELNHQTSVSHVESLQESIDQTESLKERLFQSSTEIAKHLKDWNSDHIKNWDLTFAQTHGIYTERLRLDGPTQYWTSKADKHGFRGKIFFGLLCLTLVTTAACMLFLFTNWLSDKSTPIALDHVEGLLLFITGISTVAFLSRILARVAFSEFHLQRDAEERVQLTHLYLALSYETSLEEDARNIILQALFSRAETGLLTNQSGPTMPGITDLLSALKRAS